jgi:hypothetical protein
MAAIKAGSKVKAKIERESTRKFKNIRCALPAVFVPESQESF